MKLKNLIFTGLLANAAYQLYKNKDQIRAKLQTSQAAISQGKSSLTRAQNQLQDLKDQVPELKKAQDKLNYKLRVFKEETHPHTEALRDILGKNKKGKYIL